MMDSGLPPHELTAQRLQHEGQGLVGAGMETTRAGLTTATFWIIETPHIFKRLREELEKAIPDPNVIPPLAELEALPYLSGCIMECKHHISFFFIFACIICLSREFPNARPRLTNNHLGLRLSYGVAQRSPRVSYNQAFTYTVPASAPPSHHPGKTYTIPTGCVMGMSTPLMHHNETIFPDSYAFYPERWLDASDPSGKRKDLQRHFTSFGKGSRQCLGMNLAFAELYALIGMLFRRFEFELVNTTKENVMPAEEYFVPFPKGGKADTWVRVL
jgi:cytochrome P450